MRVGEARAVAVDWVRERLRRDPAVQGAFFSGSTVGLPDEAVLPASSDVDVVLVRDEPGIKLGKFRIGLRLDGPNFGIRGELRSPGVMLHLCET
ncbi:hypothetical protein [Micromonospora globispora]|uniref:hypothetical protein n=1 Tax=Micromonospora globispora TaxID=1450148 RepID=UPI001FB045EC|nr:hypothetical protein [Micromonospora globispora]